MKVVLGHCRNVHVSDRKVARASLTHDRVGFHPMGEGVSSDVSARGGHSQSLTPTLCSPDHFTLGRFTFLYEYD